MSKDFWGALCIQRSLASIRQFISYKEPIDTRSAVPIQLVSLNSNFVLYLLIQPVLECFLYAEGSLTKFKIENASYMALVDKLFDTLASCRKHD